MKKISKINAGRIRCGINLLCYLSRLPLFKSFIFPGNPSKISEVFLFGITFSGECFSTSHFDARMVYRKLNSFLLCDFSALFARDILWDLLLCVPFPNPYDSELPAAKLS